jgi:hypothetical protein
MSRTPSAQSRPAGLTLEEVLHAPELASLELLAHALNVARVAILAQYPYLLGDEHGRVDLDSDPVAKLADRLLEHAFPLEHILRRYRAAIANTIRRTGDDFPF